MNSRFQLSLSWFLLTIAVVWVMAAPGVAAHADDFKPVEFAPAGGLITFTAPSHNIECIFVPDGGTPIYKPPRNEAELSCDRAQPTYVHFNIGRHGAAEMVKNPGEQPCCSDTNPLPYGSSWRMAPFTCESTTAGMSCRRDDGHGFMISRTVTKVF